MLGTSIRVNRQRLTIIGVAPPDFRGSMPGLAFEIWVPLVMAPQLNTMPDWMLRDRHTRDLLGLARLKPGVTLPQANAEISALAARLAAQHPDTSAGVGAALVPIWKAHSGAQSLLLAPLRILMAVCCLVLLIVCANVANLLLARATARQKEFGVRLALGAGRARLVRQLLTESLLLAFMGALAGAPLTMWMAQSLGYLVPATAFPIALDIEMNGDIFAFTLLLCVVACMISGIAPAWQTARAGVNDALQDGGRGGSAGKHSRRLRGLLVVSEVALALVAIIGAGLFARSFQLARRIHPGFDADHVLVSGLSFPRRATQCPTARNSACGCATVWRPSRALPASPSPITCRSASTRAPGRNWRSKAMPRESARICRSTAPWWRRGISSCSAFHCWTGAISPRRIISTSLRTW